ncbi:putative metallo-dependent phosphatase [Erysiphe neolycopersici]|uniref:Putative metallo-dependent phosphatase n=1 Tax=Erysiphe neolycopersici TaxID=212602 RepID=A0A420I3B4_9PEZI|nr:putative metallo-dependent phosphatase [Erysiphe neolycopersici]
MNSPYWGVLPTSKARTDIATNDVREKHLAFDRELVPTSASVALKNKPDRFSTQSEKSEAPTISTISVTPSELLGGGLAPRPPSFPYGSTGYDHNFIEKRRQRRKREQDRISGETTTPTTLGFFEGSSNYSKSKPNNDKPTVFQETVRSSFPKKTDSDISPVDQNLYNPENSELNGHLNRKKQGHSLNNKSNEALQSKLSKRLQRDRFHIETAIPVRGDEMKQLEYAPDRSPLQRLEMALGSMSKKEICSLPEEIEFSAKGIENIQNTGKLVDEFESHLGGIIKTKAGPESGGYIKEPEKNRFSTLRNSYGMDNSYEHLGNNKNHKSEQRQMMNEPFSKKVSDSDVEKSRSKTQILLPRSTSIVQTSLLANNKSAKYSRVQGEIEIQKSNESPHNILAMNVESSKSNNLSPKHSPKTGFHSNQLSSLDKNVSILPQNSTIESHNSDIIIHSDNNSKPTRRGTLNKLSRLAIDRFSTKVMKDKFKSPREKQNLQTETDKNTLGNFQSVENLRSPITPSTEYLEHRFFDKRGRENNKFPKQDVYISSRRLDEWKNGGVAQLSGTNLDLDIDIDNHIPNADKDKNRWESENTGRKRYSNSQRRAEAYDGEYDNTAAPTRFKPPLFLNCGPILRYCGLRREVPRHRNSSTYQEREIWRGTVMIVCKDSHSSYELAPTLRIFCQPIDLLPPPPARIDGSELASEYIDPIAGLPRIGRDGRTLYVRPIEQIDVEKDLSREESAIGLYEMNRTKSNDIINLSQNPQKLKYDGEKAGKYKEVRGFRLHSEQGMTFWRFNLEIELRENQQRIAYRINRGPASGFWVPPRGQAMNIIHHSSNCFSRGVNSDQFCGPDPMWRDILNTHQTQPFHVMIGGGNQICNDDVTHVSPLFKAWLDMHQSLKERHLFSSELQQELEAFYLNRYCMWFSQGLFGLAVSQIPSVNIFADHDIIDGFGSHSDQYMCSPVMSGLGSVAFKYYMLFQHQSSIDEGEDTESSWILGVRPGPYIKELSRTIFTRLGRTVAFLGLDCRTERTSEEIISLETTQKIFARLMKEVVRGDTKHLLVLMAVPYFNLRSAQSDKKSSKMFQPIKSLGRKGSLKKRISIGGEQIQDELDEKRIMYDMRDERIRLIQALQDLAFAKSIRITILGGDIKLGAVGLLYSNRKLGIPKDRDFRYMPAVISSAIVDAPVPDQVTDFLDKKSKVRRIDAETNEDIIPVFTHDVDNIQRNHQRLLNRRNWCSIRQYNFSHDQSSKYLEKLTTLAPQRSRSLIRRLSGSSSSHKSPKFISSIFENRGKLDTSRPPLSNPKFFNDGNGKEVAGTTSLSLKSSQSFEKQSFVGRTLSLTRKDFNPVGLFRRSSRRRSHSGELNRQESYTEGDEANEAKSRNINRGPEIKDFYEIPTRSKPVNIAQEKSKITGDTYSPEPYNGMNDFEGSKNQSFESTKLSLKQIQNKNQHEINLDGSLDICLNMEINQRDPAGATMPYRLIVPALSCNEAIYFSDI